MVQPIGHFLATKLPPSITISSVLTKRIPYVIVRAHTRLSREKTVHAGKGEKRGFCRRDRDFEPAGLGRRRHSCSSICRGEAGSCLGSPAGRGIRSHGDDHS